MPKVPVKTIDLTPLYGKHASCLHLSEESAIKIVVSPIYAAPQLLEEAESRFDNFAKTVRDLASITQAYFGTEQEALASKDQSSEEQEAERGDKEAPSRPAKTPPPEKAVEDSAGSLRCAHEQLNSIHDRLKRWVRLFSAWLSRAVVQLEEDKVPDSVVLI